MPTITRPAHTGHRAPQRRPRPRRRLDPASYEPLPENKTVAAAKYTGEWAAIIAIAVVVALVIKAFVLQAFLIPSPSMESTLMPGDRVLVNKLAYRFGDIQRGDIIVFERPPGADPSIKDFIKRVIGLPGDTVQTREGAVYVNNKRINEPYLEEGTVTLDLDDPVKVPAGQLFVMGDNRTNSGDSRYDLGTFDTDLVVGKAFVKVWPLWRIDIL